MIFYALMSYWSNKDKHCCVEHNGALCIVWVVLCALARSRWKCACIDSAFDQNLMFHCIWFFILSTFSFSVSVQSMPSVLNFCGKFFCANTALFVWAVCVSWSCEKRWQKERELTLLCTIHIGVRSDGREHATQSIKFFRKSIHETAI